MIVEGNIRVQRVVSDDSNNISDYYVNEFKNGKYFATGTANQYGNGIYTSVNIEDIETYNKRGKNSKTIDMIIDKNAKIMVLKDQMNVFRYTMEEAKNIPSEYQRAIQEPDKILISKGYYALYVEKMDYYIIYNRGKIYVKE